MTESEAAERTLYEIQTQISLLRNENKELSHSRSELSGKIRNRLNQVNGELLSLTKKLTGNKSSSITRDELERRQRNLEKLQTQHFLLNKDFNGLAGPGTIASSIIRSSSSGGAVWGDGDVEAGSSRGAGGFSDVRPEMGRLHADQIIRSQNEGLENLAKIISRQKSIALKIGDEVTEQNEIIDDIAVRLENTDGRINNGTQAISAFTKKDNSFALWMIILGLFVAIMIVWFVWRGGRGGGEVEGGVEEENKK